MFEIHNSISPIYLNNLIKKPPKLGLRSHQLIVLLDFKSNTPLLNALSLTLVHFLWNSLPSSLTATKSLMVFRRGLKAYLLK